MDADHSLDPAEDAASHDLRTRQRDQLEACVVHQVVHVELRTGEEVVDADHFVTVCKQALTEMRTEKSKEFSVI